MSTANLTADPLKNLSAANVADLGLGSRVLEKSRRRFLNRDGSFNVIKEGIPFYRTWTPYHAVLDMTWTSFYAFIIGLFVVTNFAFALLYMACGPGALVGATGVTASERFQDAFFFSVQTLATIGYGRMSPEGLVTNILVAGEALSGVLILAMCAGLAFARFSRPIAKIIFSHKAIVAPYKGVTAFEFRITNGRNNQLLEVEAKVILSRFDIEAGKPVRRFHLLRLERDSVLFFPLHWVVVHPIDETSPLWGVDQEGLHQSDAEFLVLLTAFDETFSTNVHTRTSYKGSEVVFGAKFVDMFLDSSDGVVRVDLAKIHDIQATELPPAASARS